MFAEHVDLDARPFDRNQDHELTQAVGLAAPGAALIDYDPRTGSPGVQVTPENGGCSEGRVLRAVQRLLSHARLSTCRDTLSLWAFLGVGQAHMAGRIYCTSRLLLQLLRAAPAVFSRFSS